MSTTETETKQIKGACQEVSERGDWTTFHIDTGGQWPVKLSTKLPELIEQGRAAKNSDAVWTFKESQGGENPHKPGTYYTNRYLSKVEIGGALEAPAQDGAAHRVATASGSGSGDGMTKEEWARKDRAADLRACIAIAAGALQHTMNSEPTEADLNEFATRTLFVARQFHGVVTGERMGDDATPFLDEAWGPPLSAHDQAIPF